MKKEVRKVGGIKGFFMWLFRMDRTIVEVEVPKGDAPEVPSNFCETTFPIAKPVEVVTEEVETLEETETTSPIAEAIDEIRENKESSKPAKPTKPRTKQSLSSKYNPNVKRGSNGRYQSLK